jgi:hypothetical protein
MRDGAAIVVAGLALRIMVDDAGKRPLLGGPAITAALGASRHGGPVHLLAALPSDLSAADLDLLRLVDPGSVALPRLPWPALTIMAPPVLGERRIPRVVGDPTVWRVAWSPAEIDGRPLILASADPQWYIDLLVSCRPRMIMMDIHGEWAAYRARALNTCLRRADLVTITEQEYAALPKEVLHGVRLGFAGHQVLILKRGARGIRILSDGARRDLPAPAVPLGIQSDLGAGDLLIGALGAALSRAALPWTVEVVQHAYEEVCPSIALLLTSASFDDFVARIANELHHP